jgi:hypothetical protein
LSHFVGGRKSTGVVGPALAGHALALTPCSGTTTAGTLPSRDVVRRHDLRYYVPLGLPLRTTRLRLRLIRAALPRQGPRRRVSPVPHFSFDTCRAPYPGGPFRAFCSGLLRSRFRLRRDMLGSAPPLFLCRGGRLHFMLRPASSLPPYRRLLMPRSGHQDLSRRLGPATRCSGAFLDGSLTRWRSAARLAAIRLSTYPSRLGFRTHHGRSIGRRREVAKRDPVGSAA